MSRRILYMQKKVLKYLQLIKINLVICISLSTAKYGFIHTGILLCDYKAQTPSVLSKYDLCQNTQVLVCKIDFISASSLQPDSPRHMKLYDLSVFTKDVCTPSLAPSVIILRSVCIFKRQCLWEAIRARLHDPPG